MNVLLTVVVALVVSSALIQGTAAAAIKTLLQRRSRDIARGISKRQYVDQRCSYACRFYGYEDCNERCYNSYVSGGYWGGWNRNDWYDGYSWY